MKLVVFFPGIGYHCDKPLLYYSRKLAQEYGYEKTIRKEYTMKARIIYEVECPPVNCDREDFLKWLELNLYVPGACVTSDNPLFGEPLDFDTADFDNIEVIDG